MGAAVNARSDQDGFTALICAAIRGHVDVVEYLVLQGAKVNRTQHLDLGNGAEMGGHVSPLMRAAHYGHTKIVKLLIAAGADVIARTEKILNGRHFTGETAFFYAAENGHTATIKALLELGAYIN